MLTMDPHPKGVIPLGGCDVAKASDAKYPHILEVTHPSFGARKLIMAAESEEEQVCQSDVCCV